MLNGRADKIRSYDSPSDQDIKKSASALDASSSEALMGGTINLTQD
jgi:hypothetical protein